MRGLITRHLVREATESAMPCDATLTQAHTHTHTRSAPDRNTPTLSGSSEAKNKL